MRQKENQESVIFRNICGGKKVFKDRALGVPVVVQWLTNPTRNHEVEGSVPALAQWVNDPALPVSCGVGCRRSSDIKLLWLWRRPVATAPIRPLAWEPPYAAGAAQRNNKKDKKIKNNKKKIKTTFSSEKNLI